MRRIMAQDVFRQRKPKKQVHTLLVNGLMLMDKRFLPHPAEQFTARTVQLVLPVHPSVVSHKGHNRAN